MNLILQKNEGFKWREIGTVIFKGMFKFADAVYSSNDEDDNLTEEIVRRSLSAIQDLSGSFLFIENKSDEIVIYTDIVRSFSLYYKYSENKLIVSDEISVLINNDAVFCKNAIKEFSLSGFVTKDKTMLKGIYALEACTILTLNKCNNIKSSVEFNNLKYTSSDEVTRDYTRVIYEDVFNDIKLFTKNKTVVVPLSGGYDSRLIIEHLHRMQIKDVICYTYGILDNQEAKISKEVAEYYNYKWIFIEYNESKWKESEIGSYLQSKFDYVSLPHIQDYIAVKELKDRNLVPLNSIFIPGHSGDFIAGSHLHQRLINCSNEKSYRFELFWKHYMLNFTNVSKGLNRINLSGYNDEGFSYANRFEKWGLKERQSKFIVNSLRIYEHFGYSWYLPLWDIRLVNFWLKVPMDQRINRKLYFDYVKPTDPWFVIKQRINTINELTLFKYYLQWAYRAVKNCRHIANGSLDPMGWYSRYSVLAKIKTFGLFSSINTFLINDIKKKNKLM